MSQNILYTKTVIVGAGVSGISAAINLLDNEYKDFLIFEALERIGGRVHTQRTENGYFDIGAQWIHGQEGNPIFEIARENNLVEKGFENILQNPVGVDFQKQNIILPTEKTFLKDVQVSQENDQILFVTQNGRKISLEFAESVYNLITKIIYSAEKLGIDRSIPADNRVGDYLYDKFVEIVRTELNKDLLDKTENEMSEKDLKFLLNGIFLMRARRENIRNGCFNIFDVSLKNFSCYQEFKGHSYVELKHGFTPILEAIIKNRNQEFYSKVYLKHFLKKIILSSDLVPNCDLYQRPNTHSNYTSNRNKAVLIICDSTNPDKPRDIVVVCDNVLCTMSLGYLKENFNNIIEPLALMTCEKRQAVERLGFGTINKIFLFYEEPFWSDKLKLVNLVWTPEDLNFRLDKLMHRNCTKKIWFEDICKFEVVKSNPNTLCAWIAGNIDFERLDDKTILIECTNVLRRFLNQESIPEPKSILRTKWNLNRYSRGAYSHLPLGSNPNDFDVLAKPIPSEENPIVMFAGEATNKEYFSTVHGAYLTGLRESKRILQKYT